ncbi:hypothetical protein SCHPADRAFT_624486 [Schizopora paradoxa]|uniref:Uncharacterized protein n=1 Tax=Schizopora paradoxa TaxID=27342 RepID=A0A0H2RET2_9AGAM|nr:hypothetical protein SCHPADRAFT_624486 [Schizopora paradoxa]
MKLQKAAHRIHSLRGRELSIAKGYAKLEDSQSVSADLLARDPLELMKYLESTVEMEHEVGAQWSMMLAEFASSIKPFRNHQPRRLRE